MWHKFNVIEKNSEIVASRVENMWAKHKENLKTLSDHSLAIDKLTMNKLSVTEYQTDCHYAKSERKEADAK